MIWFKGRLERKRSKTDINDNSTIGYNSQIKEIERFLEKNENKVLESRNNFYVEERKQLIPHKPKYSGVDDYSL